MKLKSTIYLSAFTLISGFASAESPNVQISVFTTASYPIQNAHLANAVYQLDKVELWEKKISQSFSQNPKQAEQQAKALMTDTDFRTTELDELQQAYQGVIEGWQKGIHKVPAILFENATHSSVIYGVSDVQQALTKWQQWNLQ